MCMMSAYPTYTPPPKREVEAGPESPDDMVNGQVVENINDRSLQDKYRNANRGKQTTAQTSKGYGGTTKQTSRAPTR